MSISLSGDRPWGSPHASADASKSVVSRAFRLDINALRAASVLAVLGYHLHVPGFAGGFVGVDVFFVITGYLMTRIVVADLTADRFSLVGFGMMRIRRLFPALAVVITASIIAGWFVSLPGEYQRHLRQACFALLSLSNFAFDADSGYFAAPAQTKPLLHTWSLGVEWQFYIWMPLVASVIWRGAWISKPRLDVLLGAVCSFAVASLLWCAWQSHSDLTGSAFFSLRARAWEPLAGGLVALIEQRRPGKKSSSRLRLTAALAGWGILATCVAFPIPERQWPGVLTLLPIVGAILIVGSRQQDVLARWSGLNVLQRLGEWSYSIYLWHWPIWVFTLAWLSFRGYSVTFTTKLLIATASIALGAASYVLVEQPTRKRRDIWSDFRLMSVATTSFCLLLAFTVTAFTSHGFPSRLPDYLAAAEEARRTDTPRDECFRNANSIKRVAEPYCQFGSQASSAKTAILWGDSFANQYLEPMSSAALANDIHGLIATQSACRPFIDDAGHSSDQEPCRAFNRDTLSLVLGRPDLSIVVLGGNWGNSDEIVLLADKLLASGKTVVLILPLLHISFDVPQRWMEEQARAGKAIDEWKVKADSELTYGTLRAEISRRLEMHHEDARMLLVDPQSVVCGDEYCYLVRNGQANFRDTAHISNVNAIQYQALFSTAFRAAFQAPKAR
ncbi:acyltransferase [Bradyrhizobium japonicum]|uniref:acyltransferase family protein n=1 Tax=Bradyrhizobium japonicum TaxID=375 RepID=UPI00200D2DEA|nr:acyltransferase family protein [Bradyrhizobium japonicum]UQD69337.1 acyltransferase [Bradyrhizobium japonicum]